MLLNKRTTRAVNRTVYAGLTYTVTLLKRDNDQKAGTVRSLILYRCRRGKRTKSGEPLQGDMSVTNTATWHIPRTELDRVGVAYINDLDRIVHKGEYWQTEAFGIIEVKLFDNEIDLNCCLINPPVSS